MLGDLIPMVVCTGMFAMIFGIVYIKSRENMALIEKGINPRQTRYRPRPFVNLKWGLLLVGCGLGLLSAFIIDSMMPDHSKTKHVKEKKVVISGTHGDTTRITIDSPAMKPGKQTIVVKYGNAKKEIGQVNDNLERLEDQDCDTNSQDASGTTVVNNNFGVNVGSGDENDNSALYLALIAVGGGLGLFFSYRIEKREWLDKIDKIEQYNTES